MIALVDYGMGNIHSILKALSLFADTTYTSDEATIRDASAIVMPGDGAFGAAMGNLNSGIGSLLKNEVEKGKPLLGICIGFQVLFQDSNETFGQKENIQGLGLVPGKIRRFETAKKELRIPHMGWNVLESKDSRYQNEHMYFIHSYRAVDVPSEYIVASCDYGGRFAAAIQKENVAGVQFHPEKSDRAGLDLLRQWVKHGRL